MKLNFWQWLGVMLFVVGASLYIYRQTIQKPAGATAPPTAAPVPPAGPATGPATNAI